MLFVLMNNLRHLANSNGFGFTLSSDSDQPGYWQAAIGDHKYYMSTVDESSLVGACMFFSAKLAVEDKELA